MSQSILDVENVQPQLHTTSNAEHKQQVQQQLQINTAGDTGSTVEQLVALSKSPTPETEGMSSEWELDDLKALPRPQSEIMSAFGVPSQQVPQYVHDCDRLSEAKLRKKYNAEFQSWRSRRDSARKEGLPFHQPWGKSFVPYLRHNGPVPAVGYTLDKIKPELGYVPGNTRWASKTEQTWNRPNTIFVTDGIDKVPLGVWADRHGISRNIAYRKYKNGWSPDEILAGERKQGTPTKRSQAVPLNHPWPPGDENRWEAAYQLHANGRRPSTDRLAFLLSESNSMLRYLDKEQEEHWFPDDYDADIEEAGRLAQLEREHRFFSRSLQHGRRLCTKHGRSVPNYR